MADFFDKIITDMLATAQARTKLPARQLDRYVVPRETSRPMNTTWLFEAPFAHPMWHQYVIALYDLTTPFEPEKLRLKRPGMTHEFLLYALDPDKPIAKLPRIVDREPEFPMPLLSPPNYAYQFPAADDAAAIDRIQGLVDKIVAKQLSPDTDYRLVWDELFSDGATLMRSIFDAA